MGRGRGIHSVPLRLSRDKDLAEELTQGIFLKIMEDRLDLPPVPDLFFRVLPVGGITWMKRHCEHGGKKSLPGF